MDLQTGAGIGIVCIVVFLFVWWVVSTLARIERELDDEKRYRRELSNEFDKHKFDAYDVYRALGAERQPSIPGKWVKKE